MTQPAITEPKLTEWFGEFFGHDLSFLHCEVAAIQNIDGKLLKKEPELLGLKWFDYRRMHPVKATYLFAKCYERAYQDFMRMTKDHERGRYMKPFKGQDFMEAKERKSLWQLRQTADQLGIRYEFFLRQAMTWKVAHNWHHAPRPAHINANDELLADVALAWEEECRNSLQICKDERYLASSWFGHSDQIAYENFLIGQINQRIHKQYSLSAALYTYGVLRIEAALRAFPPGIVNEALSLAG
ncbi:hypothetical protein [Paraburkholderia sp.]|uniref:hypothetical protein n=1 Tax=Paraburkholderia sp. TaxID=1926495 RepID=UPI0039E4DF77